MRVRSLVLCAVLLGAALGAAGCSSSPAASSGGKVPVGKPTGTVTVKSGNKVVCVITLNKNGTGTCKVSTAKYAPGKVTFTGGYNGNTAFKSASGSTTVTIGPIARNS